MAELTTHNLAVERGGRRLVDKLTLRLRSGECWGVLGPNGAGKSSLLLTLAGLLPAATGEVKLDGLPLASLPPRARARQIGVLFQDPGTAFASSVLEHTLQGRHAYLHPWQWESEHDHLLARLALAQVGLEGMAGRRSDTLSGGEAQRLAIATLLTQDPAMLLLDEPVNHLDLHQQMRSLGLFRTLAEGGKAVVMVLHDVNLAQRFCDHALLLHGDGTVVMGKRETVLTSANLSRLYGHPMTAVEGPQGPLFVPA